MAYVDTSRMPQYFLTIDNEQKRVSCVPYAYQTRVLHLFFASTHVLEIIYGIIILTLQLH